MWIIILSIWAQSARGIRVELENFLLGYLPQGFRAVKLGTPPWRWKNTATFDGTSPSHIYCKQVNNDDKVTSLIVAPGRNIGHTSYHYSIVYAFIDSLKDGELWINAAIHDSSRIFIGTGVSSPLHILKWFPSNGGSWWKRGWCR